MESEKRDRERGKDPDRFVEMVSGPNLEYSWIAELKAGPVPQGLDGGRVVSFSLVKDNDAARAEAPDITAQNKYLERLNSLPPRVIQIARFEDGKLTRFEDDPHAAAIIDEIRDLS